MNSIKASNYLFHQIPDIKNSKGLLVMESFGVQCLSPNDERTSFESSSCRRSEIAQRGIECEQVNYSNVVPIELIMIAVVEIEILVLKLVSKTLLSQMIYVGHHTLDLFICERNPEKASGLVTDDEEAVRGLLLSIRLIKAALLSSPSSNDVVIGSELEIVSEVVGEVVFRLEHGIVVELELAKRALENVLHIVLGNHFLELACVLRALVELSFTVDTIQECGAENVERLVFWVRHSIHFLDPFFGVHYHGLFIA